MKVFIGNEKYSIKKWFRKSGFDTFLVSTRKGLFLVDSICDEMAIDSYQEVCNCNPFSSVPVDSVEWIPFPINGKLSKHEIDDLNELYPLDWLSMQYTKNEYISNGVLFELKHATLNEQMWYYRTYYVDIGFDSEGMVVQRLTMNGFKNVYYREVLL